MREFTPEQIKKLKKLADVLDKGNVAVLEYLLDLEEKLDKSLGELSERIEDKVPDIATLLENVRGKDGVDGEQGERGEKGDKGEPGRDGQDGKDGKDGRDGKDGKDGAPGLDGKDGRDGVDGKEGPMGAIDEATIAYLEDEIRTTRTEVKALKERPVVGGVTDKAVQFALMRSIQAVTPSGTIDGVNTDFTVPSTIHAVLSFELNSRVVALGEYTITGSARKTISFDTAPSANYAGKSFVITYI